MTNAEIQPRRITLSDGRTVPTFAGMHHTPDVIKHLKEVATGKPKPRESVENRSTVYPLVAPLGARGATVGEILDINPELERKQVRNALYRADRPQWHTLERDLSPQAIKERRRRSHLGKSPLAEKKVLSQENVNSNALAKALIETGLITADVDVYRQLLDMYKREDRGLPADLAERIRLEAFLIARKALLQGNMDPLNKYTQLGNSIDPFWFANSSEEERFIVGSIPEKHEVPVTSKSDCVHHWVLGQPKGGIVLGHCKKCGEHKEHRDEQKDYRVDGNGRVQITINGYNGRGSILAAKDFA